MPSMKTFEELLFEELLPSCCNNSVSSDVLLENKDLIAKNFTFQQIVLNDDQNGTKPVIDEKDAANHAATELMSIAVRDADPGITDIAKLKKSLLCLFIFSEYFLSERIKVEKLPQQQEIHAEDSTSNSSEEEDDDDMLRAAIKKRQNEGMKPAISALCSSSTTGFIRSALYALICNPITATTSLILHEDLAKFILVEGGDNNEATNLQNSDVIFETSPSSTTINNQDQTSGVPTSSTCISLTLINLRMQIKTQSEKIFARLATLDFSVISGNSRQDPRANQWCDLFTTLIRETHEIAEKLANDQNNGGAASSSPEYLQNIIKARSLLLTSWRCVSVLRSPLFMEDMSDRFVACIVQCLRVPKLRGPAANAFVSAFLGVEPGSDVSDKYVSGLGASFMHAVKDTSERLGDDSETRAMLDQFCVNIDGVSVADNLFDGSQATLLEIFDIFKFVLNDGPEDLQLPRKKFSFATRRAAGSNLEFFLEHATDTEFFKKANHKETLIPTFHCFAGLLERETYQHQPSLTALFDHQSDSLVGRVSILIDRLVVADSSTHTNNNSNKNKELRQLIPKFVFQNLQSTEWRKRVMALCIATYVVEFFIEDFTQMLPSLMNGLILPMMKNDPHWMVHIGLCDLVTQFSKDLPAQIFAGVYGPEMMKILIEKIDASTSSSQNLNDDNDNTNNTSASAKKKLSHDAHCIKLIAGTMDEMMDNLDDALEASDSDEDEDIDTEQLDENDDDAEEFEDAVEEDDEEQEEEEIKIDKKNKGKKKSTGKRTSVTTKQQKLSQAVKLRKTFVPLLEPLARAVSSQIKFNFDGLSQTSEEKAGMMTMERTTTTTAGASTDNNVGAINNEMPETARYEPCIRPHAGHDVSLADVEDRVISTLLHSICSAVHLCRRLVPDKTATLLAELCLPHFRKCSEIIGLLDNQNNIKKSLPENPSQALECLTIIANFAKRSTFAPYLDELVDFVSSFSVKYVEVFPQESQNNNNNNQENAESSKKSSPLPHDIVTFVPYVLGALTCIAKHLGKDVAPHLAKFIPFLINVGSSFPEPTISLYEPGSPIPQSDDLYTYQLHVGDNEIEYLVRNDAGQWENVKRSALCLWALLYNKSLHSHLAPFARSIVAFLSKLLETKRDDIVCDTASAVAQMAKILPHLQNVQARQFLAFSILKPLVFAVENCDDSEVASLSIVAATEIVPFLRDWDAKSWNYSNLSFFLGALHNSAMYVLRLHAHRISKFKILAQQKEAREKAKKDNNAKSNKNSNQKKIEKKRKEQSESEEDEEEEETEEEEDEDVDFDEMEGADFDHFDDDAFAQGCIDVAFRTTDAFVALCKKYPQLTSSFIRNTALEISSKIFDIIPVGAKFFDEIHDYAEYFGLILVVTIFEIDNSPKTDLRELLPIVPEVLGNNLHEIFLNTKDKDRLQTSSFGLRKIVELCIRVNERFIDSSFPPESFSYSSLGQPPERLESDTAETSALLHESVVAYAKARRQVYHNLFGRSVVSTVFTKFLPIWVTALRTYFDSRGKKLAKGYSGGSDDEGHVTANAIMFTIRCIEFASSQVLVVLDPGNVLVAEDRSASAEEKAEEAENEQERVRRAKECHAERSVSSTQIAKLFRSMITHLPARNDEDEAVTAHGILVKWIEDKNNELIGFGNDEARDEDRDAVVAALKKASSKCIDSETKEKLRKY